jgi:dienelactone hydrolase
VTLDGGFLEIHVATPDVGAPPYPAIVSFLGDHEALRGAGFAVATFRLHWERLRGLHAAPPLPAAPAPSADTGGPVGVWLLASPSPRTVGQRYLGLIAAYVAAVRRVVDHLTTLDLVDASRLGVVGSSTNGFVSLEATAADARIAAAVAVAACGDYHVFLQRSSLAMHGAPLDLDPAYSRDLRAREPATHPERLTHAAILMLNGSADEAVPLACAEETAARLHAAYRRAAVPERFRLVVVEGAAHAALGARARDESVAWFGRWLGGVPSCGKSSGNGSTHGADTPATRLLNPSMAKRGKALIRSLNRSSTRSDKLRPAEARQGRLREPSVCQHCGAVFSRRVWRRSAAPSAALLARAYWTRCPACVQTSREEYLGRVFLRGAYLDSHIAAIRARIRNVVIRAGRTQPERRMVSFAAEGPTLEVLTTSQKLAHRIAHELKKAFGGRTTYSWADDGVLTTTWERG